MTPISPGHSGGQSASPGQTCRCTCASHISANHVETSVLIGMENSAQAMAAYLAPGAELACSARGSMPTSKPVRGTVLSGGLLVVYSHPPRPVLSLQGARQKRHTEG